MINANLANGIIGISIDMSAFDAGMAKIRASMAGLGSGAGGGVSGAVSAGVAAGVASGMSAGVARGSSQARNAMGQFTSQSVASGVASGMAAGVSQGRARATAPLTQAISQAVSSGMARGMVDAQGRMRDARGRFVGMGGGAGGGGIGGTAGQAGMGLLQGLGLSGFAMSPGQMAGQMIGGGLKEAVGTAMELQTTFVGLQRVSGESAANVEKFKRSLFDIAAKQSGVSVEDLTGIAMAGAKAGITDKEGLAGLETFTRGMAKVRNSVQGVSTEQLTDNMVRMLNLFGKSTDYVESFGSALARMDNVSTSSAGDILAMSKSLSGTFASLNLGIPAVMAFSSVLSDTGQKNESGAGAFNQILRKMASESEAMAEKIGMPVEEFQRAIRTDALGALEMMIRKFKEINDVDPIKGQEFVTELGFRGVKAGAAFQQLASMIDQVKERTAMAVEEETTLGSLLSANALNSTTTEGAVQKLKNSFVELGDAIGKHLLEPLSGLAAAATPAIRSVSSALNDAPMVKNEAGKIVRAGQENAKFDWFGLRVANGATTEEAAAQQRSVEAAKKGMANVPQGIPQVVDSPKQRFEAAMQKAIAQKAAQEAGRKLLEEMSAIPSVNSLANPLPTPLDPAKQGIGMWGQTPTPAAGNEAMRMLLQRPTNAEMKGDAEFKVKEEKRFSSQHFGDSEDFVRSLIQDRLSDKDDIPKLALKEQEKSNDYLKTMTEKLLSGTGISPTFTGMAIMKGNASPP